MGDKSAPMLIWEQINDSMGQEMHRARVPGGWLVQIRETWPEYWPNGDGVRQWYTRNALTFVPLAAWPEEQSDG